jgi:hypothetical protein
VYVYASLYVRAQTLDLSCTATSVDLCACIRVNECAPPAHALDLVSVTRVRLRVCVCVRVCVCMHVYCFHRRWMSCAEPIACLPLCMRASVCVQKVCACGCIPSQTRVAVSQLSMRFLHLLRVRVSAETRTCARDLHISHMTDTIMLHTRAKHTCSVARRSDSKTSIDRQTHR